MNPRRFALLFGIYLAAIIVYVTAFLLTGDEAARLVALGFGILNLAIFGFGAGSLASYVRQYGWHDDL